MDKKKIIIIILLLLIVSGVIIYFVMNTVHYEKIEVTSNGTTIEVPANQTKYRGQFSGVKLWNWDKGMLLRYNSHEDNPLKVGQLSYNAVKELIDNAPIQEADGFTCHVVNADDLFQISIFDVIKLNYKGKLYCISTSNQSSQDKVIIFSNNKDIAVHMANSIVYKNAYPDTKSDNINLNIDPSNMNLNIDTNKMNVSLNPSTINSTINSKVDSIKDKINSKSPIKI